MKFLFHINIFIPLCNLLDLHFATIYPYHLFLETPPYFLCRQRDELVNSFFCASTAKGIQYFSYMYFSFAPKRRKLSNLAPSF